MTTSRIGTSQTTRTMIKENRKVEECGQSSATEKEEKLADILAEKEAAKMAELEAGGSQKEAANTPEAKLA